MGAFFAYTLKAALCLIVYYLFYKLLFSRDTFHRFNRVALISLILFSFALPFLQTLFSKETANPEFSLSMLGEVAIGDLVTEVVADEAVPFHQRLIAWTMILYLAGIVFFLLREIMIYFSLAKMLRMGKKRRLEEESSISLIAHDKKIAPFSWMRYIVVNEDDLSEARQEIITHEMGHILQFHTFDLLLTELCIIFQWFNPAIWLMRQELQTIHEFEADDYVLCQGLNAKQYQLLIIKKAAGNRLQTVTNSLNQSSIKKRITMMLKAKTNPWAKTKVAIALPVALLCTAAFASPKANEWTEEISASEILNLFQSPDAEEEEMTSVPSAEEVSISINDDEKEVFLVVEQQPHFPGGEKAMMDFIRSNITYPQECIDQNIQGNVILSFVIEKDGSVSTVEKLRSPHEEMTKVALDIMSKMPKWEPGKQRGEAVRVKYVLPVQFKLKSEGETSSSETALAEEKGNPIVLVDGVELPFEHLGKINPNTIESIDVFKGQGAIEKYGEKAKNGAIMVRLKKGDEAQVATETNASSQEIKIVGASSVANTDENVVERETNVAMSTVTLNSLSNGDTSSLDNILVLVDGKEVSQKDYKKLDKSKIEAFAVVKDPELLKQYGEKGKNGVIKIRMKK